MPNASHFNPHLPCGRRLSGTSGHLDLLAISIHTFLAEGDTQINETITHIREFQSTPSLRKATLSICLLLYADYHFNPHLPCGRRPRRATVFWSRKQFQSTPSLRTATTQMGLIDSIAEFQSTPSLRKATTLTKSMCMRISYFNPHLPCGRRQSGGERTRTRISISIHTFLAEGDLRAVTEEG